MQGFEFIWLFGWFAGWLETRLVSIPKGVELPRGALIKLPRFMFAVFGWPAVTAFPVGIVVPRGAWIQLFFLLLVIYRFLVDDHWSLTWIGQRIGVEPVYLFCILLFVCLGTSKLIVNWMLDRWPYPN